MAEKQVWHRAILELIKETVGSSLRTSYEGTRSLKADKIKAYLKCLEVSDMTHEQADEVVRALRDLAQRANTGGLRVTPCISELADALSPRATPAA